MQGNLWFSQNAFIDLTKEIGEKISLCQRQEVAGNPSLGIAPQSKWNCVPVVGYTLVERMSAIRLNNAQPVQETRYVAYLFEPSFNPEMLNGSTYLLVQGKYYQLELINTPVIQRGVPIMYKYKLSTTQLTAKGTNFNPPY